MRLIDADKLIEHLNDYALMESPGDNESTGEKRLSKVVYNAIQNCIKAVDEQPTAYDPEKVVEQLKEFQGEMEQFGCDGILTDMIEIVKGGGVDCD